jgi:hypothetical protein
MIDQIVKTILIPVVTFITALGGQAQAPAPSAIAAPTASPIFTSSIQTPAYGTASGSVSEGNMTVNFQLSIPQNPGGGEVTGMISGLCQGTIKGFYDGKEAGSINGTVDGSCGYGFWNTKAGGTFAGTVYRKQGRVVLQYEARADKFQKNGNAQLSFTPFAN